MVIMSWVGLVLLLALGSTWAENNFEPRMGMVYDDHFYFQKNVWGYVEVSKGAHSFWWLQYTTHPAGYKNRPWIIWLQGGPGLSGTALGNFLEIGPFSEKLQPRAQTWLKEASIMYIDSPIGTGFSYHENILDIKGELEPVSRDLINTLSVFTRYMYFHEFKHMPLYLFGQSYGGKYASALAYYLEQGRLKGELALNLQGIAIGNGLVSPPDSIRNFGPFLLQMGVIDDTTASLIAKLTEDFMAKVKAEAWLDAFNAMNPVFDVILSVAGIDPYDITLTEVKEGPMFKKRHDYETSANETILKTQDFPRFSPVFDAKMHAFMDGPVKERLVMIPKHVLWNFQNDTVYEKSMATLMKPASFMVEWLLSYTDVEVNIYEGQFDMMCSTAGALAWVSRMQWPGREGWKTAEKLPMLKPNTNVVETYVKQYGKLRFFWNLKAGHTVPADVPEAAMRMLQMILSTARPAQVRTPKNLWELLEEAVLEL